MKKNKGNGRRRDSFKVHSSFAKPVAKGRQFKPGKSSDSVLPVASVKSRGPASTPFSCVGILRKGETDLYVDPDPGYSFEQYGRIRIPPDNQNGAPLNMKVFCTIVNPEDPAGTYVGKITEVLGDPGESDVAMKAILLQYGIPEEFPEEVTSEASGFPMHPSDEDIDIAIASGRRDLRSMRTVTIDGEDAKDLDDAISIEKLPGKGYLLYVHIADVSHYVTEGSPLDLEARQRATSVYPVDRVVPMLPPRLSNSLCSLNPEVPRFALTAKMTIDYDGEVRDGEIFESIIKSNARTSYSEIHDILYAGKTIERYAELEAMFRDMDALMRILKEKRSRRGSIEFSFPETHVVMDGKGKPTDIFASPITDANRIIEEFMIVTNEFVAAKFHAMSHPFIYRVHEDPDELKIADFLRVAKLFGAKTTRKGKITPEFLAELMSRISGETFAPALSQILLRSLAKARYSEENLGHFGLNSRNYCHFTSPIRRYPDLYIHRIIKAYLNGKPQKAYFGGNVKPISERSSEMERNAAEAEREATDQKVAEYMADHVGEEFEGIISGISQGGLFVRLQNTAEGMVPFRTMADYYEYDDRRLEARGRASGRVYRIGQAVLIKVGAVDTVLRRVDFVLEEAATEPSGIRFGGEGGRKDKKREPRDRFSHQKGKGRKGKGKKGR